MADEEYLTVQVAQPHELARKIETFIDPSKVEFYKLGSQTSSKNNKRLSSWAKDMHYHEAQTPHLRERVYLVVSDLRLVLAFRHQIQQELNEKHRSVRQSKVFLDNREIDSLHEKHWAVEVNGRYYELVRDEKRFSYFSSRNRVDHFDRCVTARIFIGTTHCEHRALDEIGKAVIATQGRYELTRDNCHRFVRVFAALVLCRNHDSDTLPSLPFGVEEHIASRAASKDRNSSEEHMRRVSREIGSGVEWTQSFNCLHADLCRTIRKLTQKTQTSVSENSTTTEYIDKFESYQEQTSYMSELHPKFLPQLRRCQPLPENPYISIARLEKKTHYRILPSSTSSRYKASSVIDGMFSGPFGAYWKASGQFAQLQHVEIIRDRSGVWRDGDGERLDWPEDKWRRFFAEIRDSLWRRSRSSYSYHTPTTDLLKSVGPMKKHPFMADIALEGGPLIGPVALLLLLRSRIKSRQIVH